MNQFKKGDKVKRVAGLHEGMVVGDTAIVRYQEGSSHLYLEEYTLSHDAANFELVQDEKESIKQFLKENSWFIRTGSPEKSKLVQKWLFEHGYNWGYIGGVQQYKENYLTNTDIQGIMSGWIMHGSTHPSAKEIEFQFETVVKSYTLPTIESEKDKKIRELQETIELATAQIKAIKEGV